MSINHISLYILSPLLAHSLYSITLMRCVICVQLGNKDGSRVTMVMATVGQPPDRQQEISYTIVKVIGSGSFGVVYQARLQEDSEMVAIKKVLQDRRFKVL